MSSIDVKKINPIEQKSPNQGTGAGGTMTNKNGLSYEKKVSFVNLANLQHTKTKFGKCKNDEYYTYKGVKSEKVYKIMRKNGLSNYFKEKCEKNIGRVLQPDECMVDEINKIIYIIEVKFQSAGGSVDEKIRCGIVTKILYTLQYPGYQIEYIYVLCDWFKQKKYITELKINKLFNIHILFGSDENYMNQLINIFDN